VKPSGGEESGVEIFFGEEEGLWRVDGALDCGLFVFPKAKTAGLSTIACALVSAAFGVDISVAWVFFGEELSDISSAAGRGLSRL